MKVENQPQQKQEVGINQLLKGLHRVSREGQKPFKYWSLSNEATDSGGGKKRKKKTTECVWWRCCIMYVWYHFVLLIWIIDMILAKCFLNNWIIYYCLCYLSVSQTWTKSPLFILSLFFGTFSGSQAFCLGAPIWRDLLMCCGPRRVFSRAEKAYKDLVFTGAHTGWPHKWKCNNTRVKSRKVCRPICNFKCFFVQCEIS